MTRQIRYIASAGYCLHKHIYLFILYRCFSFCLNIILFYFDFTRRALMCVLTKMLMLVFLFRNELKEGCGEWMENGNSLTEKRCSVMYVYNIGWSNTKSLLLRFECLNCFSTHTHTRNEKEKNKETVIWLNGFDSSIRATSWALLCFGKFSFTVLTHNY